MPFSPDQPTTAMSFGKHLANARRLQGMSQEALAEAINATARSVRRWEQDQVIPQEYYRGRLRQVLELTADVLPGWWKQASSSSPQTHCRDGWHVPYSCNPLFTGREELLQEMVMKLCASYADTWAVTGLPGAGKTSLVIELTCHPQIREYFRDGILWVGLGPEVRLIESLRYWGSQLELSPLELHMINDVDTLARRLHQCLSNRRMLLILDDAWKLPNAVTFQVGGSQCVHLLTTRSPLLAHTFAREHVISLQPLSEQESLLLFQRLAPEVLRHHPTYLQILARMVGGLPLALTLLGRLLQVQSLHGSPRRLAQTLQHLTEDIQARFQVSEPLPAWTSMPSYPAGTEISLQTAIDLSVRQLPQAAKDALQVLALLATQNGNLLEEAVLTSYDFSDETLDILIDNGLVELCPSNRYQIHQTIVDYARLQSCIKA